MTAVKLSGTFRKDDRPDNGLEDIATGLVKDEFTRHVVVGVVEPHKVTKEPGEAPVPTVRFVAIEPLDGDSADAARALLNGARRRRGMTDLADTLFDAGVVVDPRLDDDVLEFEERQAAAREAEPPLDAEPVEHHGADEGYGDLLADMKTDLGINPLTCGQCGTVVHWDQAAQGYLDAEGYPAGDGHRHAPEAA